MGLRLTVGKVHSIVIIKSKAQMAELVDALVSNTNVLGRAGSTPALGTSVASTQERSAFSWPFFV